MRKYSCPVIILLLALGGAAADWRGKAGIENAPSEIAPLDAPFDMPELRRPAFPAKAFPITDFGAEPGGEVMNTDAIRGAVQACAEAGGGRVVVPAGVWLTGAVHLQSHVNLYLAEGAVLRFSDDPEDYLPAVFTRWAGFECYNYSPLIYARDCENIAITGPGKIDGNGRRWWPWFARQADTAQRMYEEEIRHGISPEKRVYATPEAGLRPQLISPINCRNVLLEGFTIAEPGPFWTIDLVYCGRVIVRKLRVLTEGGPNTDGLNVDSSRNVLIEHCYFNTGDDCICMKSGMNEDGWRVGKPTENVVVRFNLTARGHGGTVFGSDTSGGIRNVYVHSCIYNGTDVGIRLKSTRGRGGVVEKLFFENIDMADIAREAIQITTAYRAWMGTTAGKAPVFRNLDFRDIQVKGAQYAARIEGLPEAPLENIHLRDIAMETEKGFEAARARNLTFEKVHIRPENGSALKWRECEGLSVNGVETAAAGSRDTL
jgi:polygalacturonase